MRNLLVQSLTACPKIWNEESYHRFRPQKIKRSHPNHFSDWFAAQPESFKKKIQPIKGSKKWVRLDFKTIGKEEGVIKSTFILCIDPKSHYAGNLYRNDINNVPKQLYLKFLISLPWRIVHLVLKTSYHLSMAGIVKAVFLGIYHRETPKIVGLRVVRSAMDIIRTPVYHTFMELVAIKAILLVPIKPAIINDCRALTGRLTHELVWGRRTRTWRELTPCMRRLANIMDLELNPQIQYCNIVYSNVKNITEIGLENLAFRYSQPSPMKCLNCKILKAF